MPTCVLDRRQEIIVNSIFSVLLLLVVLSVNISAKIRTDDLRLRMIEIFTTRGFDSMNQSDIDSLMSVMSKTIRRGRTFHYMWKLHGAVEMETKRLDSVEDHSSKDWVIQAFRPAVIDETAIAFTDCAVCNRTRQETRCNVTRVELLVPLIHKDLENDTLNYWISVDVNEHTINSSRGTVEISRAVVFDLSNLLIKPDVNANEGTVRITMRKQSCQNMFLKRSMLYEYCNINSTILDRFWSFHPRENKDNIYIQKNQDKGAKFQVGDNNITLAHVDMSATNKQQDNEMVESSHDTQNKESAATLQRRPRSVSPAEQVKNINKIRNSKHFNDGEVIMHSSSKTETDPAQSTEHATYDGKTRTLTDVEMSMLGGHVQVEYNLSSKHEPHHWISARKTDKKKRHLGNPELRDPKENQRDCAGNQRFDDMKGVCKRHSFFVSFQIHMNRWDIVVPDSLIDIGYCSSSCRHANHFSKVSSDLTAHAVIVNSMRGTTPGISCSPHKMSTISILKINDLDMSLVVENLLNAKVESCWCT